MADTEINKNIKYSSLTSWKTSVITHAHAKEQRHGHKHTLTHPHVGNEYDLKQNIPDIETGKIQNLKIYFN